MGAVRWQTKAAARPSGDWRRAAKRIILTAPGLKHCKIREDDPMLGLMQDYPLLIHTILDHGALNHGEREMVTRGVEGPIRRCTLAELRSRSLRVAKALEREGVQLGDRIATMAWNTMSRPGSESWGLGRSVTR
jgi:hypothetical protein